MALTIYYSQLEFQAAIEVITEKKKTLFFVKQKPELNRKRIGLFRIGTCTRTLTKSYF